MSEIKQFKTVTKQIDDYTYYIKPFPAFTSVYVSGQLSSFIGPILGSFAPLIGNISSGDEESAGKGIMDMDIENALPSFVTACSSLSGKKMEELVKLLLITEGNITYCSTENDNAKRLTMDDANEIFCMNIQNMFVLCFEVIKLNFGGFFENIGTQFGGLLDNLKNRIPTAENTESST